jgi:hypothetical protein
MNYSNWVDASEAASGLRRTRSTHFLTSGREPLLMTTSKNRRVNAWHQRKHNPQPHGKIKSFAELAEEPGTLSEANSSLTNEHAKQASQQLL